MGRQRRRFQQLKSLVRSLSSTISATVFQTKKTHTRTIPHPHPTYSQAFHLYELRTPEIQFGIRFEQLLAAFGLFSAGPGVAEVTLQYPGRGAELVIRSWHAQEVTFAHLGAVELPSSAPRLDQHWEGAVASFIAPGALLRDAVDDLDWAGKSARIRVSRDPAGLSFLSSDQTLRLEVPYFEGGVMCTHRWPTI